MDQERGKLFFDYMNTRKDKKVNLVTLKLKGEVSAWWDQIQSKRITKIWPRLMQLHKESLLPINYEHILYDQYHNCTQETRRMGCYVEEFNRLGARLNIAEGKSIELQHSYPVKDKKFKRRFSGNL